MQIALLIWTSVKADRSFGGSSKLKGAGTSCSNEVMATNSKRCPGKQRGTAAVFPSRRAHSINILVETSDETETYVKTVAASEYSEVARSF